MADKMWKNIFLSLLTIGTILHRLTSLPIDCAKLVQKCPVEKDQWTQKNNLLKCAANYGYVCLRNSDGYLFETCMANFPVQANSGNCPILYACKNGKSYLGPDFAYYPCPEEVSGCPPKNHPKYSIHQLYKFPRCIESTFSTENGITSPTSTKSILMATRSDAYVNRDENVHVVIIIVTNALLFTVIGCFISYAVYSRKKKHGYSTVTYRENKDIPKDDYEDLRDWIQSINESEADRIRILPLKEDNTIQVDRIYVPVSIVDGNEIHSSWATDKGNISDMTPGKMFTIAPGKLARFIFLLGDAGYGKTVQCRRIAKSWCTAWKADYAQGVNDIQSKNLENGKNGKLKEWEKILKDFEFLFYVPMRDVNNEHVHVDDMIYEYYRRFHTSNEHLVDVRAVLKDKRYKCLIIVDGLDEWNISESKKLSLLNKGLPNCNDISNCTILFTMRSWRFMEVDPKCRQGLFDKVVQLHGLDDSSIQELTKNMLCNYFNIDEHSVEFLEQNSNIRKKSSLGLKSLMRIPLLAVFCILTWHEDIESGCTLTTFYLSMVEALMKREQIGHKRGDYSKSPVSSILNKYSYINSHMPEILLLGKMAFDDCLSQNTTFVLSDTKMKCPEIRETLNLFLSIGLLTKHDTPGRIHENNVRFSFLHKTIQEFIFSLYLFHDRSETDIVRLISKEVPDIEKVLELSTFLTFVSGLSPAVGCKISRHIAELSSSDEDIRIFRDYFATETYNKVFHLFNLQLSCYREVRGWMSIEDFQESVLMFSLSDIILLGNHMDRVQIRESADVLRYHFNDIKSLCMKCIPNDIDEGITNIELTDFLHKTESLVALDIDGYDRGKCRLFDDPSKRLPCLRTLGLFNVAFTDNILTHFLRKDESKIRISALGLIYMKSADDLDVDFQYQFSSVYRLGSARSGYVQKRIKHSLSEISKPQMKENGHKKPLLKDILGVLPEYRNLSTLRVSYMDSEEDRQMLLHVLPHIKSLLHFGYDGTSVYPNPDYVYDTAIIKVLLKIKQLEIVFLHEIILKENILNFETSCSLKQVTLEVFAMNQPAWWTFVLSLSNIETLYKVILNDTDIDDRSYEKLQSLCSLDVVKDESTAW